MRNTHRSTENPSQMMFYSLSFQRNIIIELSENSQATYLGYMRVTLLISQALHKLYLKHYYS